MTIGLSSKAAIAPNYPDIVDDETRTDQDLDSLEGIVVEGYSAEYKRSSLNCGPASFVWNFAIGTSMGTKYWVLGPLFWGGSS